MAYAACNGIKIERHRTICKLQIHNRTNVQTQQGENMKKSVLMALLTLAGTIASAAPLDRGAINPGRGGSSGIAFFPSTIVCDRVDGFSTIFYQDFMVTRNTGPGELKTCYSRVGHNTAESIMFCFDNQGNFLSSSRDKEGSDISSCGGRHISNFRVNLQ